MNSRTGLSLLVSKEKLLTQHSGDINMYKKCECRKMIWDENDSYKSGDEMFEVTNETQVH